MFDLLAQGGYLFMLPLTLLALAVVGTAIWAFAAQFRGSAVAGARAVFHLGLFAFVLGLLSQAISLYQMFAAIESVGGSVAPALVVGGLRVSLIAPVFGVLIFVVALVLHGALRLHGRVRGEVPGR